MKKLENLKLERKICIFQVRDSIPHFHSAIQSTSPAPLLEILQEVLDRPTRWRTS